MDVPEAAAIIAVADVIVAALAGIVIFPIVFTFDLEPSLGTELAFSTLPAAFSLLSGGRIVAGAFFGLLFAAAITSAVSMMEVGVSTVRGETQLSRRQATVLVSVLVFFLGMPSLLSYTPLRLQVWGTPFLDLLDTSVGTLGLPVTALIISITFGYFVRHEELRVPPIERLTIMSTKYLLPPVLVAIIASQLFLGFDFPGWHTLPGSTLDRALVSAAILVCMGVLAYLLLRLHRAATK
jgi:NSS family neurotransmitter:Na+ symporter